jgi:putative N6-adenine-specific DNA methylase
MKAFAITNLGMEKYASEEVEELLDIKTKTEPSVILFDVPEEKIAYLSYKAQSLIKVCSLVETFKFTDVEDFDKLKADFSKIIPKGKTIRVKASRQGDVDFKSIDLEINLAESIFLKFKEKPSVSLENPDYIIYLYICDDKAYLGIDYVGFDLSKRDYRVFANSKSLRGNVEYLLLRIAEFKSKETLVDPFCLSGEIGIEAALFATRKSPCYFAKQKFAFNKFMKFDFEKADKEIIKSKGKIVLSSPNMPDVRAAQKNAKLAGVEKELEFTRQDMEWLDFRLDKNTVDKIVSLIPCPSSNMPERKLDKLYEDFMFQIKLLLKKNGKVVLLGRNLNYFKTKSKELNLSEEIQFYNNKESMEIMVFEKK